MRTFLFAIGLIISSAVLAGGYEIGDKVKDFKLKNIDGKMVSLADMKDAKGAIVIFTCNHCPYSVATEDRIIALDKKYKKKAIRWWLSTQMTPAIQPEDSFDKMKVRAKEKGFTFPYIFDEKQTVYKEFGASKHLMFSL
jgi:peroxiredoxin